jgi:urea transporter
MARLVAVQQQTQPSLSLLPSSLSDFNGTRLHSQVQVCLPVFLHGSPSLYLLIVSSCVNSCVLSCSVREGPGRQSEHYKFQRQVPRTFL